jgi:AcrR family transcriptional regulator
MTTPAERPAPLPDAVPAWLPTRDPLGRPAAGRTLRVQGEDTVRRLLDAGRRAFAGQGYAASRIDDVVALAGTSHGTFYLYFRNKEDLLHRLAIECAEELDVLTATLVALDHPLRADELTRWVADFIAAHRRHSSVVRVWLERRDLDPLMQALANDTLGALAGALQDRLRPAIADRVGTGLATLIVFSLLERMASYLEASDGALDEARTVTTIAAMMSAAMVVATEVPS